MDVFHAAGVIAVDTGLACVVIGLACLPRPPRKLWIRTRRRAGAVAVSGVLLVVAGMALPSGVIRMAGPRMRLDELIPLYQFGESHELLVEAPPARVYAAVRGVTAAEIRLFRTLTWIRSPRLPGRGPETILSPSATRPILDVALGSGFLLLSEEPGREVVIGAVVCCGMRVPPATPGDFMALAGPGAPGAPVTPTALALMNFHLEEVSPGRTRLVTQTRILATNDEARRRFAAYWRTIYPGSALMRRMWLRAIKRRAENAPAP